MNYHVKFDIDFKRNSSDGLYIALEGIDGSGKTTQLEKLQSYFKQQRKEVIATREPRNDGIVGSLIREILKGEKKVPSVALQYLFSADRSIHHQEIVLPALSQGKVVITDRCFWSAVVYGILDRGDGRYDTSEANQILIAQSILSMYHQFTAPDYTFYLRISLDTAMERIQKQGKEHEIYEDREKLEKLIGGYEWLVDQFKNEIVIIDGEKSVEEVTDDIRSKITS